MLKPIVIDGSNVALSHGNNLHFSCRGIRICVDWFKNRGHKEIKVFVPSWRKENPRTKNPIRNQEILLELEREDILVFTPSRWICEKRIICYDDRYILKFAADINGIVVSNDNYRDIVAECHEFKNIVKKHLLMYSFINDKFMPPDDPLGRLGPSLDEFLKVQDRFAHVALMCPYEEKCTYGYKCKYRHENDDSCRTVSNHFVLRKTVSAPPYINQQASELAAKPYSSNSPDLSIGINTQINSKNNRNRFEDNSEKSYTPKPVDNDIRYKGNGVDATEWKITTDKFSNKRRTLEVSGHKPLAKTSSAPITQNNHEKLTRLCSTPFKQGQYSERIDSVEDPIIEKRKIMQFHLSYIFPKENVESIFKKFPCETDPNVLCKALLELNL